MLWSANRLIFLCIWMCITCYGYRWPATFYADAHSTQSIIFEWLMRIEQCTNKTRHRFVPCGRHPVFHLLETNRSNNLLCTPDLLVNILMSTFRLASSRCFIHVAKVMYTHTHSRTHTFWAQCMKLRRVGRRGQRLPKMMTAENKRNATLRWWWWALDVCIVNVYNFQTNIESE